MNVFLRVIERGSLSAAGRELGLSPAAISNQIRSLEDWLGTRLLNRTTRQLTLTEAGEAFRDRCETILSQVSEAEAAAAALQGAPRGLLRLTAPTTFAIRYLGPVVAAYLARFPEVQIDMVLNDRVVDLIEEGFDLAIRIGELTDSNLIARQIAPSRFAVCAAPSYLERCGEPSRPSELADHHCLEYSLRTPAGRWLFAGPEGQHSTVSISGRLRATNGDLLRSAAVEGLGITLAPTFIVGEDIKSGRLVPLLQGYEVKPAAIFAVRSPGRNPPLKVRSFIDFLIEWFSPTPDWDCWQAAGQAARS
ncbi:LysR family transcriptional regulator [Bradyrhizobium sp. 147]|uniref:LysR family transcriptional regulator n=1 Tax=Bradyrhizobium sp. 147 TaxID=2782623 RepID=UPI001FF899DA|nr:LysR family transcriptional regulator [Bradyrhizobium sp. 147]